MKGGNRKFSTSGVLHIYQRARDRGIIFYTVIDRLIYLSILSVKSRQYEVKVLAVSIMFSHIHQSCRAGNKERIYKYVQDSSSVYARAFNYHYGLKGSLFSRPFGSSLKRSVKEIRSNLAYVNNNHVESGLCKTALQARWNLLAYRDGKRAMPEAARGDLSEKLIRSMKRIDRKASRREYLTYRFLLPAFEGLDAAEEEILTDHIILRYPLVDYSAAEGYYGGFEKMLTAFDSNTGSEFAIREEFSSAPDTSYEIMADMVRKGGLTGVKKPALLRFTKEKRLQMVRFFFERTDARKFQIYKFLHLSDQD